MGKGIPDRSLAPPADYDPELCWPGRIGCYRKGHMDPGHHIETLLFNDHVRETWKHELETSENNFNRFFVVRPMKWREYQRTLDIQRRHKWPLFRASNSPWCIDAEPIWRDHFVHMASADRSQLSYIASVANGQRGIYTRIKIGRYLEKFFSTLLTEAQITRLVEWQMCGHDLGNYINPELYEFGITQNEKKIIEIYLHGPNSCMTHSAKHFHPTAPHPVTVYSRGGDLAIAYLRSIRPRARPYCARCLVWPEKKVGGRVYPTGSNYRQDGFSGPQDSEHAYWALRYRLTELGYQFDQRGLFNGAKLGRILTDSLSQALMPYLDGGYCLEDCTTHFCMRQTSTGWAGNYYNGQSTHGLINIKRPTCENCAARGNNIFSVLCANALSQRWCAHCANAYSYICAVSDRRYDRRVWPPVNLWRPEVGTVLVCRDAIGSTGVAFYSDLSHQFFLFNDTTPVRLPDGGYAAEVELDPLTHPQGVVHESPLQSPPAVSPYVWQISATPIHDATNGGTVGNVDVQTAGREQE